ncbi:PREDICTED: U8 snoRNA-decapping enzyme-like [Priapulus caudatus]|uniref:U8 snoRNA-decapping enzyme n=1 Tax=Priapulus caudatus TaxID=37621 RepID=A0ABM1EJD0_PRICU|nr:PREDICTED: U8 snoRNA-decapping enzyme-like [Priapulus caudatus]XP_014672301.1 PREDICTED: U8 snoRNA-decapping enzyme-like [Priapulus caudatus]
MDHAGYEKLSAQQCRDLPEECTHAAHCIIYAHNDDKLWGKFPLRAAVMMQVRFDGLLGFPGGLVDKGESWEQGLNRELQEEIALDLERFRVEEADHVGGYLRRKPRLRCYHCYVKQVSLQEFLSIETAAYGAPDYGSEVLGVMRVPLHTLEDGKGGLPAFLQNRFVGAARDQLLFALQTTGIMSGDDITSALCWDSS